jgi:2-aminoadipate transaminase
MYAERVANLKSSAIRDILKVTSRPDVISFAGGLPAPELFPVEEIRVAADRVLTGIGAAALQYSVTEGLLPLREMILRRFLPRMSSLAPGNVLIAQGSQQGLDLIGKLLLDKGSAVFTENPSYLGALQAFRLFQADVTALSSDDEGVIVDDLRERLKRLRPRLLYVMPSFRNPTGGSLSLERRRELVDVVREHELMLVEDDPYGELFFEGEKLPTLFELGNAKNFIYLSSFSKVIAPGLRVAYIAADEEILKKIAIIKQGTDLQTNTFGQHVVREYLEAGGFEDYLVRLRTAYRDRRDAMLGALERRAPKGLAWNRPRGGMFLWATLPQGRDAKDLLLRCLERNVAFVPGGEFFPDGSGANTMRLNFTNAGHGEIDEGIGRIVEALLSMGSG